MSYKARPDSQPQLRFAVCEATGKRGYYSKRDARTARARHPASKLSLYRCEACGNFHIGHLAPNVCVGIISRKAFADAVAERAR